MSDSFLQLGLSAPPLNGDSLDAELFASAEKALVEGLRAAREEAYEELIQRFQQPVYNTVYRMLNDPNDASDVVQEVFFRVFRRIHAFRGESSLKTWIYRIAVNEACNRRRYFQRHIRQELALDAGSTEGWNPEDTLAVDGRSPFDEVLGREQHELLQYALSRINPVYRAAVILRDIEELSYEEIADVLQVALGTVKSRILRGREALKAEYLQVSVESPVLTLSPQHAE
ncbi:MAG: sigma-70 family RNA polymerase sigma factor [Bryobacterales bacterium]|nr:sigma-70 family RNA polymerase sigma factor [Bryobacterales bacterium]